MFTPLLFRNVIDEVFCGTASRNAFRPAPGISLCPAERAFSGAALGKRRLHPYSSLLYHIIRCNFNCRFCKQDCIFCKLNPRTVKRRVFTFNRPFTCLKRRLQHLTSSRCGYGDCLFDSRKTAYFTKVTNCFCNIVTRICNNFNIIFPRGILAGSSRTIKLRQTSSRRAQT